MKQYLRSLILNKLKELPFQKKNKITQEIHKNLFKSSYWQQSTVIGITLSKEPEWDTYEIIKKAWSDNKQVTTPVTNQETNVMHFYLINSLQELKEGAYKIKEPQNQSTERYFEKTSIDLMVVAVLVFDEEGDRIGVGKGYCDRYLADFRNKKVSMLAEFQIINQIPINEYDISVDCLITEKRIIKTR